MNITRLFLFIALIFVFQGLAIGQSVKEQVRSIDDYCKTVEVLAKKAKRPDLIFADTSDYRIVIPDPNGRSLHLKRHLKNFVQEMKLTALL